MKYKSFRDKLRVRYGCHDMYDVNQDILDDIKLVDDWRGHEPIIIDGKLSFNKPHKMWCRYPVSYTAFIRHIDPRKIDSVATLNISPDEFFRGLVVQCDQKRLNGLVIKAGSHYESDQRHWTVIIYKGKLDIDKLYVPWWYDTEHKEYTVMLHDTNSSLLHIRSTR